MPILYLDLASHSGLLACVDAKRVLALDPIDHRVDDAGFADRLEKLLASAGLTHSDLTQLACVVGPGGFTSLRVAAAAGNALSWALQIPVCGVHLSDVYAARFSLPSPAFAPAGATAGKPRPSPAALRPGSGQAAGEGALWLHSTKKHELFLRGFGPLSKKLSDPVCITLDALGPILKPGMLWMGELIAQHHNIVKDAGLKEAPLMSLPEILPSFLSSQSFEKRTLEPWYGRQW